MYRYAQINLQAVGPTRVVGVVEISDDNEIFHTEEYIDISDRLDIDAGSWYDVAVGDFVPAPVWQPSLAETATNKRYELYAACSDAITRSSFQSDALGAVHNYDCRLVDQMNLKVRYDICLNDDSTEPLWASDGTRYQWKEHTAAEIMEVMVEMNEHIKTAQVKLATKLGAVDAATTVDQILAIVW